MWEPADVNTALDEIARGNVDAFCGLVRAHSLGIRSYLCSQVYNLDQVDDLTQEVFIAAYRSLQTFRRGEDFSKWLRGIARMKLQMYFRTSARRHNAIDRFREDIAVVIESELDLASSNESPTSIEALLRCISQLPEKLKRVVHGGLDGTKPALLAASLSTTVGAVYNLHYRANQLLRDCVKKEMSHGS